MMDYQTVAVADKFGNVSIVRLGQNVNDNVDEDPTGTKSLWDRGLLSGAAQKSETLCVFHIGETVLSLQVRTYRYSKKAHFGRSSNSIPLLQIVLPI